MLRGLEIPYEIMPEGKRDLQDIAQQLTPAVDELCRKMAVEPSLSKDLTDIYLPLAGLITLKAHEHDDPFVLGINGAQGSGKSTICELLKLIFAEGFAKQVVGFSIDDIYLPRASRVQMAENVHPLFITRGVPGTHDIPLGLKTMEALKKQSQGECIRVPSFDKACDDRRPEDEWQVVCEPVDIIILEGWCVDGRPQEVAALQEPVNRLEEIEDRDGRWRTLVNKALAEEYQPLFEQIDMLLMLKVPDMESVFRWRSLQEEKLQRSTACTDNHIMNPDEIKRFIEHYERITRHILDEMPDRADILLHLNRDHRIEDIDISPAMFMA